MSQPPVPRLSRALLGTAPDRLPVDVQRPTPDMLALPERAVQFGTGALLRGLVDWAIDAANTRGRFNGRVVAIGSTGSGRDQAFAAQDGLFTLVSRGLVDGEAREERRVISSVSRALRATDDWHAVLAVARDPAISVVFSNTTEVGLVLTDDDDPHAAPPASFPAKLTRFLFERARAFSYDTARGVVVVPCELVEHNGDALQQLVLTLAARWQLDPRFASWIHDAVPFCNTLVDRIVPGAPTGNDAAQLTQALGYRDDLLTTSEQFRQFVIEGDEALAARLGFADAAAAGIVVVPDVTPYRQRKVGLLNGAHTLAVTAALLCGCETVRDAMRHPRVGPFIRDALLHDMVPALDVPGAAAFAQAVLERFANPFIRHALVDITLQGTTKFRVRLVPTFLRAAALRGEVPPRLAFGLAAHLAYLRGDLQAHRRVAGLPVPPDAAGERITAAWRLTPAPLSDTTLHALVAAVLADTELWGTDLTQIRALVATVAHHLQRIVRHGADAALDDLQASPPS